MSLSEQVDWKIAQLKRARAAEQTSQESHALLRAVVEGITDAVFVKDQQGRYLMINSAGASLVGKSVEEVLGKDDTELFTPETARPIMESDRRILATGETLTEERDATAAGVTRTYVDTKGPYRGPDGNVVGVIGIAHDITARKRLQVERDRLLERLRLQIDRLPLAYILHDADNRVLDWNPAAEKMFGYTREEVLGRDPLDLILPLPVDGHVQEILRRVHAGDMQANSVNENRTKDGRIITCEWFNTPLMDPDGRFADWISLAQDITERKRTEEALHESLERIRLLLDSTAEAIYGLDLDGRCTFCNPACLRLLGYADTRDLLGKYMHRLVHHTRADGTSYPLEECRICRAYRRGEGSARRGRGPVACRRHRIPRGVLVPSGAPGRRGRRGRGHVRRHQRAGGWSRIAHPERGPGNCRGRHRPDGSAGTDTFPSTMLTPACSVTNPRSWSAWTGG